jgi:hypothetical protein
LVENLFWLAQVCSGIADKAVEVLILIFVLFALSVAVLEAILFQAKRRKNRPIPTHDSQPFASRELLALARAVAAPAQVAPVVGIDPHASAKPVLAEV